MDTNARGRATTDEPSAVSFDLFGTLVASASVSDPATRVATELERFDIAVPRDWETAYTEHHIDAPPGGEISLVDHVTAALESRGVDVTPDAVKRDIEAAVFDAFETTVQTREGAVETVDTVSQEYPVGILSNCSIPGVVSATLDQSALDPDQFDAIISSVDCGWRKPDQRAFDAIATELNCPLESLVHIGDDPATDGGAAEAGGAALLLNEYSLAETPALIGGELQ